MVITHMMKLEPMQKVNYGKKIVPKIEEEIIKHKIDGEIVFTEKKGHATELAKEAIEYGFQYIIAVGGDGTLNEVASAMVNNLDVILGIKNFPVKDEKGRTERTRHKVYTIRDVHIKTDYNFLNKDDSEDGLPLQDTMLYDGVYLISNVELLLLSIH